MQPEEVDAARDAALAAIAAAADLDDLKRVRTEHAGDRSPLALANREIGALPPQARKEAGQRVGRARGEVNQALAARQEVLEAEHAARILVEETVDVTLPTDRLPAGARHPITTGSELIADIFVAMGWEVAEGPVIEAEWLNFDALNLGADHPARTMQDTFWTAPDGDTTTPTRCTAPAPAWCCAPRPPRSRPAPCCRRSRRSTSSLPAGCSAPTSTTPPTARCSTRSRAWPSTRASRWRTSRAPSTTSPPRCSARASRPGSGRRTSRSPSRPPRSTSSASSARASTPRACRTCKGEGWIEWGGCGVVNPRVLTACGVDAERYTGFAFGMGIDRTLMFRHGLADLRALFEGDVRFTTAFGTEL